MVCSCHEDPTKSLIEKDILKQTIFSISFFYCK